MGLLIAIVILWAWSIWARRLKTRDLKPECSELGRWVSLKAFRNAGRQVESFLVRFEVRNNRQKRFYGDFVRINRAHGATVEEFEDSLKNNWRQPWN